MDFSPFVHLHTHTEYSMLDGACKIDNLVEKLLEYKMPGAAITDHGNLFGALDFYRALKKEGLKPIFGQEFYIAPHDRKIKAKDNSFEKLPSSHHLIILAKDNEGFANLRKLSSLAYLEGFYYKPRIDKELLSKYSKGLICLSACLAGEIPFYILSGNEKKAKKAISEYVNIFGKENFFVELMYHQIPEEAAVNKKLIEYAGIYGLNCVITNDNHYIKQEDSRFHNILLAIQTGETVDSKDKFRFNGTGFHFKSYEEMKLLFPDQPQAYLNTLKIMEMCNVDITFGANCIPKYSLPSNETEQSYLKKLVYEGLSKRYPVITEEINKRIEYELSTVEKMGFPGYFLIVWDVIKWAKDNGIYVGPGRGSAGGSMLAYILRITDIDPLKYNLLFERFLNPDRISMPDIDIDIQDTERDRVINYIKQKYGEDHVTYIAAFDKLKAKAAIKDVARALKINPAEANSITKFIDGQDLKSEFNNNAKFNALINGNEKYKELFEISCFVEGLYRHTSLHAAGIVITPTPAIDIVPLFSDPRNDIIATQFEKDDCESLGLLKMDFLGIRNLTVLKNTIEQVEKRHGKRINLEDVPLDDKKMFTLFQKGNTKGCFQIEREGMVKILKRLQPTTIDEITAVLALYRPGPIKSGYVDQYVERKKNPSLISYPFPECESILKETYGVIVYQEQIMKIAMELSGFTGGESDLLRKAISKKKGDLMEQMREKFISGAEKRGKQRDKVEKLFRDIENFAEYCFNKSHSAAYAYVTIYTGFFKANYPLEFMNSLLISVENTIEDIGTYIEDTKHQGIDILLPDVNKSEVHFSIENNGIRYGLAAIKGVGEAASDTIISERKQHGEFKDLLDFLRRVDLSKINKRVLETLIKIGAFDWTKIKRKVLTRIYDDLTEYASQGRQEEDLFSDTKGNFDQEYQERLRIQFDDNDFATEELFAIEREHFGCFITKNPISKYKCEVERMNPKNFEEFISTIRSYKEFKIIGYIEDTEERITKNGSQKMYYLVGVNTGFESVKLFYFQDTQKLLDPEMLKLFIPRLITISVRKRENLVSAAITKIEDMVNCEPVSPKEVYVYLSSDTDATFLEELKIILDKTPGESKVRLFIDGQNGSYCVDGVSIKYNTLKNILQDKDYVETIVPMF